jgi:hypothetical protein
MSASILKTLFAASAAVVFGSAISACAKGDLSPGFGATDDAGDLGNTDNETGAPVSYTLGGTVTGLVGAGLTLESNGQTVVIEASDKTFAFQGRLARGAVYKVSGKTQPTMPAQTCVVTDGEGTVSGDVSNVAIACTTNTYVISVNVTGLAGSGLVLRNNGGDDLTIAGPSPATGSFSTKIESGAPYNVAVQTMPQSPSQICTVSGGKGTVVAGEIKTVTVNCATTYTVGGTVTGLAGSGLVLQNNAGGDIAVNANGSFAFAKPETTGAAYAITVKAQPTNAWQTCTVTNGTGVVATANVTTASVVCLSNPLTIRGSITGLSGAGAKLQNNGGDTLTLAPGATSFAFPVQIRSGGTYAVSVLAQPSTPSQSCVLGAASGTVQGTDVSSVTLTCTTQSLSLGGTVTGLVGSPLVLQNSNGDTVGITGNGAFAFPVSIASGSMYAVTVKTQPTAGQVQSCVVANANGTMGAAAVTNVQVSCTASLSTVGGSVQGLVGAGLTLKMNGTTTLLVNPNTPNAVPFTFPSAIATGAAYTVAIAAQPTSYGQTCVITSGGSGTAPSTNVQIRCGALTSVNQTAAGGSIADGTGTCSAANAGASMVSDIVLKPTGMSSLFAVRNVIVTLNGFQHAWAGDVTARLTHVESGTNVVLFSRVGTPGLTCGSSSEFSTMGTYAFSDSYTSSLAGVSTMMPVPGGLYKPSGASGATTYLEAAIPTGFFGRNAYGTWRLEMSDGSTGDTGSLASWTLALTP